MTTKDMRAAQLLLVSSGRVQIARFIGPHDGDTVANRIRKPITITDQFLRILVVLQRALAQRTDKDVKKARVQGLGPVVAGG